MYLYLDQKGYVKAASKTAVHMNGCITSFTNETHCEKLLGSQIKKSVKREELRIAVVCNWDQECGISTYTKFLLEALSPKVGKIRIFSEVGCKNPDDTVEECWTRGHSLKTCAKRLIAWKPDFIIIQHEFGIFPKATHFLAFLQAIQDIPYTVVLHSVYQHLDKAVCTSAIKNIMVHSIQGKQTLIRTGNSSKIYVIPHGCLPMSDKDELWNIFQTPYCMVQFGFGFFYKGVNLAIEAIYLLKKQQPDKYKDIFYCYLCSENEKTKNIQNEYFDFLSQRIKELDLVDNVAIIRKFQTEETLSSYLRTAKLALFPYVIDPDNTVYGASGAIRIAMTNKIPVIASTSHLFDDLEGILPRPSNAEELAYEIDKVFSDGTYRNKILRNSRDFVEQQSWPYVADLYLDMIMNIISG